MTATNPDGSTTIYDPDGSKINFGSKGILGQITEYNTNGQVIKESITDPLSDEPLQTKVFDPDTHKLVDATKFDPKTSKPQLQALFDPNSGELVKGAQFDPKTGKRILTADFQAGKVLEATEWDPETGHIVGLTDVDP